MVDGVIYFYNIILLVSDSKLKERLLDAIYEILLSKPTGFVRAYHTLLGGFIWEGFKEEVHSHMKMCMDYLVEEEEHSSGEEPPFTPPYSLSVRGSSSMSYPTDIKQVYREAGTFEHYNVSPICLYFLTLICRTLLKEGTIFMMGFMATQGHELC